MDAFIQPVFSSPETHVAQATWLSKLVLTCKFDMCEVLRRLEDAMRGALHSLVDRRTLFSS